MFVISSRLICTSLFITLLALSAGMVSAPGSAPAPEPVFDCVQTLINLSNCLSYVMNGSNATDPDQSCCLKLQALQAKDEQMGYQNGRVCLCGALNNQPGLGVQLNVSKVFSLTDACDPSSIPPVANCNSSYASDVPPGAPPPETLNTGFRAIGSADPSSVLLALTTVAVAFFIY